MHSHWIVAPKIQQLSGLDLSENHLYTDVLPLHGYHMPSGKGGCVWDVGANNGVYNSNSHYLIHEKKFKGFPLVFVGFHRFSLGFPSNSCETEASASDYN